MEEREEKGKEGEGKEWGWGVGGEEKVEGGEGG